MRREKHSIYYGAILMNGLCTSIFHILCNYINAKVICRGRDPSNCAIAMGKKHWARCTGQDVLGKARVVICPGQLGNSDGQL